MKIKYTFATGENTEVEVNDEIGTIILDSRRIESNADRKERYHCYSLESVTSFGDKDNCCPKTDITPLSELLSKENTSKLLYALNQLTEAQRRRLLKLADGMSIRQIAESEGKHHSAIEESIEAARKKLKKVL